MKTTKEGRTVLREAAEWEIEYQKKAFKETPTNSINSNYCIDLLDDLDTLESRLEEATRLLERAKSLFLHELNINVDKLLSDLSKFTERE